MSFLNPSLSLDGCINRYNQTLLESPNCCKRIFVTRIIAVVGKTFALIADFTLHTLIMAGKTPVVAVKFIVYAGSCGHCVIPGKAFEVTTQLEHLLRVVESLCQLLINIPCSIIHPTWNAKPPATKKSISATLPDINVPKTSRPPQLLIPPPSTAAVTASPSESPAPVATTASPHSDQGEGAVSADASEVERFMNYGPRGQGPFVTLPRSNSILIRLNAPVTGEDPQDPQAAPASIPPRVVRFADVSSQPLPKRESPADRVAKKAAAYATTKMVKAPPGTPLFMAWATFYAEVQSKPKLDPTVVQDEFSKLKAKMELLSAQEKAETQYQIMAAQVQDLERLIHQKPIMPHQRSAEEAQAAAAALQKRAAADPGNMHAARAATYASRAGGEASQIQKEAAADADTPQVPDAIAAAHARHAEPRVPLLALQSQALEAAAALFQDQAY